MNQKDLRRALESYRDSDPVEKLSVIRIETRSKAEAIIALTQLLQAEFEDLNVKSEQTRKLLGRIAEYGEHIEIVVDTLTKRLDSN